MKKSLLIACIVLGVALILVLLRPESPQVLLSGSGAPLNFTSAFTIATSTIATTSTQLLAADTSREYLRVQNVGAGVVSCYLDDKTAASSSVALYAGITIYPTSTAGSPNFFEVGPDFSYTGAINCVASANTVVAVTRH